MAFLKQASECCFVYAWTLTENSIHNKLHSCTCKEKFIMKISIVFEYHSIPSNLDRGHSLISPHAIVFTLLLPHTLFPPISPFVLGTGKNKIVKSFFPLIQIALLNMWTNIVRWNLPTKRQLHIKTSPIKCWFYETFLEARAKQRNETHTMHLAQCTAHNKCLENFHYDMTMRIKYNDI